MGAFYSPEALGGVQAIAAEAERRVIDEDAVEVQAELLTKIQQVISRQR